MENKIKHLEFIQTNISRMNQCSFQMKGWALTIVTALLTLYATTVDSTTTGNVAFIFIAIVPTVLFWFLDSYYLQQERKFRGVYNEVAGLIEEKNKIPIRDFEMPLDKYHGGKYCYFKVLFSRTEWPLYLSIIVGLIIAGIFLK